MENSQGNDFEVKVITSLPEIEKLKAFWESGQQRPGADYGFFRMLLRTRLNIIHPCVLALMGKQGIEALWIGRVEKECMVLRLGYLRLFSIPVRQLTLVEGGFIGPDDPKIWKAFHECVGKLLKDFRLQRAVLEHVRSGSIQHDVAFATFSRLQISPATLETPYYSLRLPLTWEDFLKERGKKHRYWLKRLAAKLDSDFSQRWRIRQFSCPSEVQDFAEAADQVAGKTYQRALGAGFSKDEETIQRLQLDAKCNRLRGYVLYIDEKPAAFWYAFTYKETIYLASTGYDPAYRTYEVGTVVLMKLFADHCGSNVRIVDFGLGDASYKKRFASESFAGCSIFVFAKNFYGILLNLIHVTVSLSVDSVKAALERWDMAQVIKKRWRRLKERQVLPATANQDRIVIKDSGVVDTKR